MNTMHDVEGLPTPVTESRGRQWAAQVRQATGCPDSNIYATVALFNSRRDAETWLAAYCLRHGLWLPSQRIREFAPGQGA